METRSQTYILEFEEAERLLVEALSKGQNDPNTLVNIICCFKHQGKSSDLVTDT